MTAQQISEIVADWQGVFLPLNDDQRRIMMAQLTPHDYNAAKKAIARLVAALPKAAGRMPTVGHLLAILREDAGDGLRKMPRQVSECPECGLRGVWSLLWVGETAISRHYWLDPGPPAVYAVEEPEWAWVPLPEGWHARICGVPCPHCDHGRQLFDRNRRSGRPMDWPSLDYIGEHVWRTAFPTSALAAECAERLGLVLGGLAGALAMLTAQTKEVQHEQLHMRQRGPSSGLQDHSEPSSRHNQLDRAHGRNKGLRAG
jgi:hypothetical protein